MIVLTDMRVNTRPCRDRFVLMHAFMPGAPGLQGRPRSGFPGSFIQGLSEAWAVHSLEGQLDVVVHCLYEMHATCWPFDLSWAPSSFLGTSLWRSLLVLGMLVSVVPLFTSSWCMIPNSRKRNLHQILVRFIVQILWTSFCCLPNFMLSVIL